MSKPEPMSEEQQRRLEELLLPEDERPQEWTEAKKQAQVDYLTLRLVKTIEQLGIVRKVRVELHPFGRKSMKVFERSFPEPKRKRD